MATREDKPLGRSRAGLRRRAIVGLGMTLAFAGLLVANGLLCSPRYLERFGVVERLPGDSEPWHAGGDVSRGSLGGQRYSYRMLERRSNLRLSFSPFPEEERDRFDDESRPRTPHIEVLNPRWQRYSVPGDGISPADAVTGGVAADGSSPGISEATLRFRAWTLPFPAAWLLNAEDRLDPETSESIELWIDRHPYRFVTNPAQLGRTARLWTVSEGMLLATCGGERPGALRLQSPLLEESQFPPPREWLKENTFPIMRLWLGDEQREALYLPTPASVEDQLQIPTAAVLSLGLGVIDPNAVDPGRGVIFEGIFVQAGAEQAHRLFRVVLDPREDSGRGWKDIEVPLENLDGLAGTLRVTARARGPNRLYHAMISNVRVEPAAPAESPLPNVALIVLDALRPDYIDVYGGPEEMPNLARLVPPATSRYRAVSTSSWTLPAVASLFSGLYPSATGLPDTMPAGTTFADVLPGIPTLTKELSRRGWRTLAVVANPFLKNTGLAAGFERYVFEMDAPADHLVDAATRGLDSVVDKGPFLVYLHLVDTHLPYWEHRWKRVGGKESVASSPTEFSERSVVEQWKVTPELRARTSQLYRGEIRFVDRALGRLNVWMVARGVKKNTIVVVVSDHGEEFWEHGGFEHGHSHIGEVCRTVLMIHGVAGATGKGQERPYPGLASLLDVRPTVLSMIGLEPDEPCQGVALSSENAARRTLFSEGVLYGPEEHAAREWPFKLIKEDGRPSRLFNLARDPRELTDLAEQNKDVVRRLEEAYSRHRDAGRGIRETVDASGGAGSVSRTRLDTSTLEQLRALGYFH